MTYCPYSDLSVIRGYIPAFPFNLFGGNPIAPGTAMQFSFLVGVTTTPAPPAPPFPLVPIATTDVAVVQIAEATPLPDGIGLEDVRLSVTSGNWFVLADLRNHNSGGPAIAIGELDVVFKILRTTGVYLAVPPP